jgi:hypothetical protein
MPFLAMLELLHAASEQLRMWHHVHIIGASVCVEPNTLLAAQQPMPAADELQIISRICATMWCACGSTLL